jgi:hypothetical protein
VIVILQAYDSSKLQALPHLSPQHVVGLLHIALNIQASFDTSRQDVGASELLM